MHVRILGGQGQGPQYMSSYLLDGRVAVDAGCLGFWETPSEQKPVRHIFLTHCHIDHVASLPLFLENVYEPSEPCVCVYGPPPCLQSVREHLFNDVLWPDFEKLPSPEAPFVRMYGLEPEVPLEVEGLRITPVEVNHTVPAYGYLVQDQKTVAVFGGDSGPTDRIWELAAKLPGRKTALVEACFPNAMEELANAAKHLTPRMFETELAKMPWASHILAVHLKPRYRAQLELELRELGDPRVRIAMVEGEYEI